MITVLGDKTEVKSPLVNPFLTNPANDIINLTFSISEGFLKGCILLKTIFNSFYGER